jgi:alkylation response protein AidB-like acyl-CoA dehydrogenase
VPIEDLSVTIDAWLKANWSLDIGLGEWWRRLFDAGYAFPSWPVGLGGFDATPAEREIVTSAMAEAGAIGPPAGSGPNMTGPTLLRHGTAEQRRRFLPPLGRGEVQWCQLFSEPGAGSDLASLATRAELDGDELVISGQKIWSSRADVSDWGMLLCRTDIDLPKRQGITFVMIDMRQPGIEVRPVRQMNGDREFCEVFLTEARARLADVIGDVNEGWTVARTTLASERTAAAAGRRRGLITVDAGVASGHLAEPVGQLVASAAAAASSSGGRPEVLLDWRSMRAIADRRGLGGDPVVRDRLMQYFVDAEVHRLNRGRVDGSMLKLSLAMLAHQSRDLSMAMLGAEGMLSGAEPGRTDRVQRAALSSFVPSIGGGTNEIQRNIIGERNLGLPREPGDDEHVPFRELRR